MAGRLKIARHRVDVESRAESRHDRVPHQGVGEQRVGLESVEIGALGLKRRRLREHETRRVVVVDLGRRSRQPAHHPPARSGLPAELGVVVRAFEVASRRRRDRGLLRVDILVGDEEPQPIAQQGTAERRGHVLETGLQLPGIVVLAVLLQGIAPVADVESAAELVTARAADHVDQAAGRAAVLGFEARGLQLDLGDGVEVEDGAPGAGHRVRRVLTVDEEGVVALRRAEDVRVVAAGDAGGVPEHRLVGAVERANGRVPQVLEVEDLVGVGLDRVDDRGLGHHLDLALEGADGHLDRERGGAPERHLHLLPLLAHEARQAGRHGVGAGVQSDEQEPPVVRGDPALRAADQDRRDDDHGRARQRPAFDIRHCPQDPAGGGLRSHARDEHHHGRQRQQRIDQQPSVHSCALHLALRRRFGPGLAARRDAATRVGSRIGHAQP